MSLAEDQAAMRERHKPKPPKVRVTKPPKIKLPYEEDDSHAIPTPLRLHDPDAVKPYDFAAEFLAGRAPDSLGNFYNDPKPVSLAGPPLPKAPPRKVSSDEHMEPGIRKPDLRPGEHAGNTGADYVAPPEPGGNVIGRMVQKHLYYDTTGKMRSKK